MRVFLFAIAEGLYGKRSAARQDAIDLVLISLAMRQIMRDNSRGFFSLCGCYL